MWRATVKTTGLRHGIRFHELRHCYASLLIRHGESVKTVQSRLGHASAVETLNTYAHLWPDSEDRTRTAIDEVLLRPADIGQRRQLKVHVSPTARGQTASWAGRDATVPAIR